MFCTPFCWRFGSFLFKDAIEIGASGEGTLGWMANDFRKRRIEKNLTREQVADKSGVAVSNICKWDWPSDFREYDCRWHKE